jgi:hypothetical protein
VAFGNTTSLTIWPPCQFCAVTFSMPKYDGFSSQICVVPLELKMSSELICLGLEAFV